MNDAINSKDLLDFFFHTSDSMQTFWGFYITIVLGLIAFFATVKNINRFMAVAVIIAFALFAFVNLSGIIDIDGQRIAAASKLKEMMQNNDPLANVYKGTLNPPLISAVIITHLILDFITAGSIWYLVFKKAK